VLSLRRDETTGGGLTRIARETVDLAVAHLTDSKPDIHEARKRFKEVRAVLRLGRFMLDGGFASLNRRLRDTARQLAAIREADALVELVETLRPFAQNPLEKRALTRVRRILGEDREEVPEPDRLDLAAQLAAVRDELSFAEGSFARGLRRTYRDGRRWFRAARKQRTPESIHEWRKRVKDLWYHAQILAPVWPELMAAHTTLLHDLSRLLGDHHDICALAAAAGDKRRFGPTTSELIAALAERRRIEIEAAIFEKGAFVYAESPRAWSERMVRYWQAWTSGTL
jgi:CHAD domain-containing protein